MRGFALFGIYCARGKEQESDWPWLRIRFKEDVLD
jgi:hypothetical protein